MCSDFCLFLILSFFFFKATKRHFRIDELVEKEQTYLENLDVILEVFKTPMEQEGVHKDLTRDSLFNNIEQLRALSA